MRSNDRDYVKIAVMAQGVLDKDKKSIEEADKFSLNAVDHYNAKFCGTSASIRSEEERQRRIKENLPGDIEGLENLLAIEDYSKKIYRERKLTDPIAWILESVMIQLLSHGIYYNNFFEWLIKDSLRAIRELKEGN